MQSVLWVLLVAVLANSVSALPLENVTDYWDIKSTIRHIVCPPLVTAGF